MADRISSLPDSIIRNILSFLPPEQAVATSVLSKRWMPLWLAIPTLNFDDSLYRQNQLTYYRFLRLVYNVMLLRDEKPPIQKFRLTCDSSFCDSSTVRTWILTAIQRKVEDISISLSNSILSFSVFNGTTLVVLKLSGFTVNTLSSVSFPSLKILHMRSVCFKERQYIPEILSACLVLEVLIIKDLKVSDNILYISELHLPKLVKADILESNLLFSLKSFSNVEFLRAKLITREVFTHNFSHLTYLEIKLSRLFYYWVVLIELLYYCPQLQTLVIDKLYTNESKWSEPQLVPECILSKLNRFHFREYGGKDGEFQVSRFIIQNARVLRNVTICSESFSGLQGLQKKFQMIKDLSSCPRGSIKCELYFE